MSLNESIVEDAALEWFLLRPLLRRAYGGQEGYSGQVWELVPQSREVEHGPHLAPGEYAGGTVTPALSQGERESCGEVVQSRWTRTLTPALSQKAREKREAIRRLNPDIPEEAREAAFCKVLRMGTPSLTQTNRAFAFGHVRCAPVHRMLRDGSSKFQSDSFY